MFEMSKSTITRLFGLAVALVVAGVVTGTVAVIAALANGAVAFGGPQLVTINPGSAAWAIVALLAASLCGVVGTITAIGAWGGALLNTYRLEDKAWFFALLVSGLVSLGWIAMIAYVLAGPDSTASGGVRFGDTAQPGADRP